MRARHRATAAAVGVLALAATAAAGAAYRREIADLARPAMKKATKWLLNLKSSISKRN